ncbi:MAG: LamG domain-containing protein, partial [Sedimentisphaerales bacterium]
GDDYVDCGNPDSLNVGTGDWTISAWIKTTQSGIEDTDKGTVFAKGADGGGGIRYALAVNEGQLGSITLTTDNDVYKVQAISRTAVNDGAWHHVVGLRNAAQLRVYVDGTLDAGGYLPAGYDLSGTSQRNASIGVITDYKEKTLIKYFVGQVDEVCVFGGAIDANGVGALFSGKDPAAVAQTAIVAGASAAPPKRTGGVPSPSGEIEGNWQVVSSQVSQKAVLEIRKKSDGTLDATIVTGTADEGPQSIPLSEVTFEERKLSFRIPSNQGSFEGTMNEDGSAIEGQFTQGEQAMTLVLQRMAAVQPKATTIAQGQIPERTGGTGNTATTLILILALAGVIGAVVLFIVKSSIRK